jgi:hypothetical protein
MRSFTDGNGNNSTAAVQAHLATHRQLLCADLFQIKTLVQGAPWSKNLLLTTAQVPLQWNQLGLFLPARLKRGSVQSKIGLEAVTLDLEWYLLPTDMMYGSCTMLQAFQAGLWDNGTVSLYRAVLPAINDCNTYGACQMFTGRIADQTMTRTGVQLKVNCPLELLDMQLPLNLIEPGNPAAQYAAGQPPSGCTAAPVFTVQAGTVSTSMVLAECTTPNLSGASSGYLFGDGIFDFGYIQFTSGSCQGMIVTVRRSAGNPSGLDGFNQFYLYGSLPWLPAAGDTFIALVPYLRAQTTSLNEMHVIGPAGTPDSNGIWPVETVAVNNLSQYAADKGVTYANGQALTLAGNTPGASGQYGIDGQGHYYFSHLDAGVTVYIAYSYVSDQNQLFQGFKYVPVPEDTV